MDILMSLVRYGLIALGTYLATRGFLKSEDVTGIVEQVLPILGTIVSALAALWGVYIGSKSKRVPKEIAAKADVPTISPVTGAVEPASKYR